MHHLGILRTMPPASPGTARFVEVRNRDYYVYAPEPGVFEPAVELGEEVSAGDRAGLIHFVDNPAREPVPCTFRAGGLVVCRRAMGLAERGDCLFHLATDV